MRTAAGLHADQTRRQLGEERQHLLASELPGDDDLARRIDAVDLEHLLCKVEPDGGNCRHGRPSLVIRLQRSLYGTSMPCEAPSTSSLSRPAQALLALRPVGSLSHPKVTFVTRLQSHQLPSKTARQLQDLSTIIRVEPSSTYMSGQVSRAHLVLLAREQRLTPLFLLSPIL